MASSYQATFQVAGHPQAVEQAVYHALVAAGLTSVHGGGGVVYGSVPISWTSWGENVTAVVGFGPAGALVTVESRCALPTQLVDWGKNRKNVEQIVQHLRALVPVY